MANVYSASFVSFANLTGTESLAVPAGFVWVVRDVELWADTTSVACITVVKGSDGQIFYGASIGGSSGLLHAQWAGHVVLEAGQNLTVAQLEGECDVTICGYQLTAP